MAGSHAVRVTRTCPSCGKQYTHECGAAPAAAQTVHGKHDDWWCECGLRVEDCDHLQEQLAAASAAAQADILAREQSAIGSPHAESFRYPEDYDSAPADSRAGKGERLAALDVRIVRDVLIRVGDAMRLSSMLDEQAEIFAAEYAHLASEGSGDGLRLCPECDADVDDTPTFHVVGCHLASEGSGGDAVPQKGGSE